MSLSPAALELKSRVLVAGESVLFNTLTVWAFWTLKLKVREISVSKLVKAASTNVVSRADVSMKSKPLRSENVLWFNVKCSECEE